MQQGFYTSFGRFVNREEALQIAKEANMVIPYNEETKHLVDTNEEAPEYYRY